MRKCRILKYAIYFLIGIAIPLMGDFIHLYLNEFFYIGKDVVIRYYYGILVSFALFVLYDKVKQVEENLSGTKQADNRLHDPHKSHKVE